MPRIPLSPSGRQKQIRAHFSSTSPRFTNMSGKMKAKRHQWTNICPAFLFGGFSNVLTSMKHHQGGYYRSPGVKYSSQFNYSRMDTSLAAGWVKGQRMCVCAHVWVRGLVNRAVSSASFHRSSPSCQSCARSSFYLHRRASCRPAGGAGAAKVAAGM